MFSCSLRHKLTSRVYFADLVVMNTGLKTSQFGWVKNTYINRNVLELYLYFRCAHSHIIKYRNITYNKCDRAMISLLIEKIITNMYTTSLARN